MRSENGKKSRLRINENLEKRRKYIEDVYRFHHTRIPSLELNCAERAVEQELSALLTSRNDCAERRLAGMGSGCKFTEGFEPPLEYI